MPSYPVGQHMQILYVNSSSELKRNDDAASIMQKHSQEWKKSVFKFFLVNFFCLGIVHFYRVFPVCLIKALKPEVKISATFLMPISYLTPHGLLMYINTVKSGLKCEVYRSPLTHHTSADALTAKCMVKGWRQQIFSHKELLYRSLIK